MNVCVGEPDEIVGEYTLDRVENGDEFLRVLGYSLIERKLILTVPTRLKVSNNYNCKYTVALQYCNIKNIVFISIDQPFCRIYRRNKSGWIFLIKQLDR